MFVTLKTLFKDMAAILAAILKMVTEKISQFNKIVYLFYLSTDFII